MPRVHLRTRKRAEVKRPMNCASHSCKVAAERDGDREIRVGDSYYTWARKSTYGGMTYFQHEQCGRPRPTQLSSRKTAQIDEAISDAEWPTPVDSVDDAETFVDEVKATLASIGEVAREVGQEYQDGFDNMPEGLQQGGTGQAMEEVASELESWADEIDSWEPDDSEPDAPEKEEGQTDEEHAEAVSDYMQTWCDDVLSSAQDACSEYPEYQG